MHHTKMYYNCLIFLAREPKQYMFNNVSHSLMLKLVNLSHHKPHVFQKALVFSQLMKKFGMSSIRIQKEQISYSLILINILNHMWCHT